MIHIIEKWYLAKKKFNLILELLHSRNIDARAEFSSEDENSCFILRGSLEEIKKAEEIIDTFFALNEGGMYIWLDSKVNINKPISVIDINSYPTVYYAKLMPNYLNEQLLPIKIFKDKKVFGFAKFDPENTLTGNIIVTNTLHEGCEEMKQGCFCYQGEDEE